MKAFILALLALLVILLLINITENIMSFQYMIATKRFKKLDFRGAMILGIIISILFYLYLIV